MRPQFEILSEQAAWIRAPSFASAQRDLLADLLAQNRPAILARRALRARLFGGTTRGSLDHGSLRPHPLPSGKLLWLGTTRPHRAENMIDGTGIAPDVAMDPALLEGATRDAALAQVLRELEGAR